MNSKIRKLIFLVSFVFILTSCKSECKHDDNEKGISDSCYPNSKKPSQIITYEEMSDMMIAYDKGAKIELDKYLKKESGGKDSVSTEYNWYKLEDLKQYIAYIERISKEKNIPVTGFRIYPTQYPKNYSDKKLQNRNTLIFTPTTTIAGKEDAAFEPLYSEDGKPVGISEFLEKVRRKNVQKGSFLSFPKNINDLESSSANRLRPNPPY
ncbi:hypothetical protein [uncultured Polaribacter sp.]|uniref:hypothetical protein n=1 Tax=uncultured Polaribacter sp. TaxID=174711 RepID=UPI0030D76E24|tara:strand:+ start:2976 stop:3602 length:627 start_codon:yes stop_codon:yes gene_type:complete